MTSKKNLRRRRLNYFLPSEALELLSGLVGSKICGVGLGIRDQSLDEFLKKQGDAKSVISPSKSTGGPFFISLYGGKTIALYGDDLLGSIVLRQAEGHFSDLHFLENLEAQDHIGERLRPKMVLELFPESSNFDATIASVEIYKLPDNFYYRPIGYDLSHECAIRIILSAPTDIVLAAEIIGLDGESDVRIVNLDELLDASDGALTMKWKSLDE